MIMARRKRDITRPLLSEGFTLVEAVVLLVIIGIIASVAAPRFLSISDMNAAQAHRQTLSDLRFAQRIAMHSGCPVQVDFATTTYLLRQRAACRTGAFSLDMADPVTQATPFSVSLPAGVSVTSSVDPLVFDALGRATTSAGAVSDVTFSVGGRALEAVGETGLIRVP
ncbi:MAG: Tfp pilus assembly protein FimT/FimU [Myxococcota bacterium]